MEIRYTRRSAYGTTRRYALDPEVRAALAKLTGQTTITDDALDALGELGFTFKLCTEHDIFEEKI